MYRIRTKWKIINWDPSTWKAQGQTIIKEDGDFLIDRISFGVGVILATITRPFRDPPGPTVAKAFMGWDYGDPHQYHLTIETPMHGDW